MTYRPAGSRSVDEILASSRATRERVVEAREGARQDIDRAARRRAGSDRPASAAAAPAGVRPDLSTPLPAAGEALPAAVDGQAEQAEPADADVAVPVEPGHKAPAVPEATVPVYAGPGDPDPGTAPPVQSGQAPEPPEATDRSAEPSRTEPEPAGGASQAATPPAPRRTNAEKKQAVLALLQAEPGASDREIARRADVSPQTVSNIRKAAAAQGGSPA